MLGDTPRQLISENIVTRSVVYSGHSKRKCFVVSLPLPHGQLGLWLVWWFVVVIVVVIVVVVVVVVVVVIVDGDCSGDCGGGGSGGCGNCGWWAGDCGCDFVMVVINVCL